MTILATIVEMEHNGYEAASILATIRSVLEADARQEDEYWDAYCDQKRDDEYEDARDCQNCDLNPVTGCGPCPLHADRSSLAALVADPFN